MQIKKEGAAKLQPPLSSLIFYINFSGRAIGKFLNAKTMRMVEPSSLQVVIGLGTIILRSWPITDGGSLLVNHEDVSAQAIGRHTGYDFLHRLTKGNWLFLAKLCLVVAS